MSDLKPYSFLEARCALAVEVFRALAAAFALVRFASGATWADRRSAETAGLRWQYRLEVEKWRREAKP